MIPSVVCLFTTVFEASGPFRTDRLEIQEQRALCRPSLASVLPGLAAVARSLLEIVSPPPPQHRISTCIGRATQGIPGTSQGEWHGTDICPLSLSR